MRFSKFCATLLSTALLTGQSVAQSSFQNAAPSDNAPATVDENIGTPAMWRVTDADSEFFLLGTFHILPPELKWRTPAFEEAFKKAETVYFEVDSNNANEAAKATHAIMTQGINPDGGRITNLLTDENATKFLQIVSELNLPLSGIDTLRPWRASLSLSYKFIKDLGFNPESGVESALTGEARGNGKKMQFFETISQQLTFFANLSPETEMNMLVETIENWEDQKEGMYSLLEAWSTGNVDFLKDEMITSMRDNHPEAYKALIVDRNKAWAEEIAQAMNTESGTAMVAVGAGHLVGDENSVPALLAAMGFEVSRYGLETAANDNTTQDAGDDIGDLLQAVGEE